MNKFLPFMMVLAFLVNGASWARKKSSDETDSSGSTSKHHSHKKSSKGSKNSKSKTEEGFNSESEINKKDVTFNFEEKGKKAGKSKKKKEKTSDSSEQETQ